MLRYFAADVLMNLEGIVHEIISIAMERRDKLVG